MTCEKRRPSALLWSHGITRRPLRNWMPLPGPVAYQVQPDSLTCAVISEGTLQDLPSSVERVIQTVRSCGPVWLSVTRPGLLVIRSRICLLYTSPSPETDS